MTLLLKAVRRRNGISIQEEEKSEGGINPVAVVCFGIEAVWFKRGGYQ